MKVKEEREKTGLKLNRLYFPGLQNHCRCRRWLQHEIKRHLLLGRKAMTNLDSILKSRDITLPTKVRIAKAMAFPVVMYGCESWTIKKAEHQRIDAFELWCWRRLLRVPWTARISNQSILNEINPEYLLEGLRLKLKLQYFSLLMWRADSLEKTLMLGKIEGRRDDRRWDGWMTSLTQWMWVSAHSGRWWRTGRPAVHGGHKEPDMTEQLNNKGSLINHSTISLCWLQDVKERQWIQNLNFILNQTVAWKKDPGCIQGLVPSHIFPEPKVHLRRQVKKKRGGGKLVDTWLPGNCILLGKKQRNKGNLSKKVMQIVKYLSGTSEKALLQVFGNMSCLWDDHLEEGMTTLSSILAWRIPMDKGAFSPWGRRHSWATKHTRG